MESLLPFEDSQANAIAVGIVIAVIGAGLLVWGFAMKLACHICGGNEIGLLRGVIATVASLSAANVAAVAVVRLTGESSPWIAMLYATFAAVCVLALVLVQNPIRALFTYIVAGFLQTVFGLAVAGAAALAIYFAVPEARVQQMVVHFASLGEQNQAALFANLEGQELSGFDPQTVDFSSLLFTSPGPTETDGSSNDPIPKNPVVGVKSNPFVD